MNRELAELLWDFWRCPTTSLILAGTRGDDKVLCTCRKSNPKVLQEQAEVNGTHIKRFLTPASVDDWLRQEESSVPTSRPPKPRPSRRPH